MFSSSRIPSSAGKRRVRPAVVVVTPYLAEANNGNWRTAARWARMLASGYRVILQAQWPGAAGAGADALVALHARRSHAAVRAWRDAHPRRPLVVCLTGTDLYRDLPAGDPDTAESLSLADRLVVLQEDALTRLDAASRAKAVVIHQSARTLRPAQKSAARLRCVWVGHLRPEKDPLTAIRAWRSLPSGLATRLDLIGAPLDDALGDRVCAAAQGDPRLRLRGPLPHAAARQAIRRAHALVISSLMEGGANVVVEALTAGTPVLASRVSGNLGMLGADYPGYFAPGDAAGLARLAQRAATDPAFLAALAQHCARRAPLFAPGDEAAALRRMLAELLPG